MLTFRWFILRLFWSLFLLFLLAFPLLWLLHEVAFPGVALADGFLILLFWILLFAGVSLFLSRLGANRFSLLETAGREAIAKNDNAELENVLALMQSLFTSGLPALNFQQKVKRRLLRQYFAFYAAHLETERNREQIRAAWREDIRAEEAYELLKNYILQQPALTLPTIDLAEELLEHQPDDSDLLTFMTRQYLRDRQTHFRAEHIYRHYLSRNGPLVPEIISLCLGRLLRLRRQDDFAAWCYIRAFQHGEEKNAVLRQLLHEIHQRFERLGRHDALAKAVTTITRDFLPEEIAGWTAARQEKQKASLRFRAARIIFTLQQQLLTLYSRLREQRRWVYSVISVSLLIGAGYFALSSKPAKVQPPAASVPQEDPTTVYFALQVGAMRSAQLAESEAEKLRRRGLEVHVIKPAPSQRLHRIRVGKYRSKQAAQMAADSLKAAGIVRDYFVTEYEKP
ncbi:MAG: SPOR domain-containing protein [candidate division KSB1 bacterium]|nr:SPOR domain-containing protein [candidate division KSB1 bacterium]MDZ7365131.1 SPOR domain-containing protein [candidate division KSB1 bacterium]MDZ7404341.1 SPOR domain-containing protein [candidate division KSB1 bacterium]